MTLASRCNVLNNSLAHFQYPDVPLSASGCSATAHARPAYTRAQPRRAGDGAGAYGRCAGVQGIGSRVLEPVPGVVGHSGRGLGPRCRRGCIPAAIVMWQRRGERACISQFRASGLETLEPCRLLICVTAECLGSAQRYGTVLWCSVLYGLGYFYSVYPSTQPPVCSY